MTWIISPSTILFAVHLLKSLNFDWCKFGILSSPSIKIYHRSRNTSNPDENGEKCNMTEDHDYWDLCMRGSRPELYLWKFGRTNDRVTLLQEFPPLSLIVKRTVMWLGVPMGCTEVVTAPANIACGQTSLLSTNKAALGDFLLWFDWRESVWGGQEATVSTVGHSL